MNEPAAVRFQAMGCEVMLSPRSRLAEVRALFAARERRFSRFLPSSELSRINANPCGVTVVSEELSSMIGLGVDAARATGGLVTPAVGGALLAAGYDRDFARMPLAGDAVEPARVPSLDALVVRPHLLLRVEPIVLDLNGVVKGKTVDDALALVGSGWVSAGGDIATTVPVVVGLPGGDETITLHAGGLATSSVSRRAWSRGGATQHHLIDPADGRPARSPWRDVTVAAQNCVAADVAAKAALLLGGAGPSWLDRRGLAGRFVDVGGAVHVNESWASALPQPVAA